MNANIYVVFKDGVYNAPCGSLRSVVTKVKDLGNLGDVLVDTAAIRQDVKVGKTFSIKGSNGALIEVRKDTLV